jgi:hypothetical protein
VFGRAPTLTGDNGAVAIHHVHRQSIGNHRIKHSLEPLSPVGGATESRLRIAQRHHMLIFGQRERSKPVPRASLWARGAALDIVRPLARGSPCEGPFQVRKFAAGPRRSTAPQSCAERGQPVPTHVEAPDSLRT